MTTSAPTRSILVATDMQPGAAEIIRNAAELSVAAAATLHVVHSHDTGRVEQDVLDVQRTVHEKRAALDALLAEALLPATRLGTVRVTVGRAAPAILEAARELGSELIVLGGHRQRRFGDRLVGSTAELVLREATVPCLLLNGALELPLSRALVPVDFSSPSDRAIDTALEWVGHTGRFGEAALTLAHVVDTNESGWREQELTAQMQDTASSVAGASGRKLGVDVAVLRSEDAAGELIRHGEATDAGLVILGTHGDGMLMRALLGSISSAVVRRSPLPVMLVPRSSGAAPDVRRRRAAARPAAEPRALAL